MHFNAIPDDENNPETPSGKLRFIERQFKRRDQITLEPWHFALLAAMPEPKANLVYSFFGRTVRSGEVFYWNAADRHSASAFDYVFRNLQKEFFGKFPEAVCKMASGGKVLREFKRYEPKKPTVRDDFASPALAQSEAAQPEPIFF